MSKPAFYALLIGRLGVGLTIIWATGSWFQEDVPLLIRIALDLVLFGLVFVVLWSPPYRYSTYRQMRNDR